MTHLPDFLIIVGLLLNLLAIIGINLYTNVIKKAHCFSLSSNCGFVFFIFGVGIKTGNIIMAILSSLFLFCTTPMLSSLLGKFTSEKEKIKEVFL